MHLVTRNVNTAFKELLEVFTNQAFNHEPEIIKTTSRNGNVLMVDEPVLITPTLERHLKQLRLGAK